MEKFGLELAEEKTRLLRFGRFVPEGKADTFEFLGFKHVGGVDRRGRYSVVRIPSTKSCSKFLSRVKVWLQRNRHANCVAQRDHLRRMLKGFFQYFGLWWCKRKLNLVRHYVYRLWAKALRGQSQKSKYTWANLGRRSWFVLPMPRVCHPNV